jgi:hypothetical protein
MPKRKRQLPQCEDCETEYTKCSFCEEYTYCDCACSCCNCSPEAYMCKECAEDWLDSCACGDFTCELCRDNCGYCESCSNRLCFYCTDRAGECPYCEQETCDQCIQYCEYCETCVCEDCMQYGTECVDCGEKACGQCSSIEQFMQELFIQCIECEDTICNTGLCHFQCDCIQDSEIRKILEMGREYLRFQLFEKVERNIYSDIDIIATDHNYCYI